MGTAQSRIILSSNENEDDFTEFPSPSPSSLSSSTSSSTSSTAVIISNESNNENNESDDEFVDCMNFENVSIVKPLEGPSRQQISAAPNDDVSDDESLDDRKERQRKEMEEFREEIKQKREMRHACMKKLREEMTDLREKLASEIETNAKLRETLEMHGIGAKPLEELNDENKKLRVELSECQLFLQTSNSENINKTLEVQALRDHIRSLKEVIKATKEMLNIRENQVTQMKGKLSEIEETFAEKETQLMSKALQQEYQRQLENIRSMRELYEQRANLLAQERDTFKRRLENKEHDLETEIEK
jgi:chromosome segregation ATPase